MSNRNQMNLMRKSSYRISTSKLPTASTTSFKFTRMHQLNEDLEKRSSKSIRNNRMLDPIDEIRRQMSRFVRSQVDLMRDFKEAISVTLDHLETNIILEETPNSVDGKSVKAEITTPPRVPIKIERGSPIKMPPVIVLNDSDSSSDEVHPPPIAKRRKTQSHCVQNGASNVLQNNKRMTKNMPSLSNEGEYPPARQKSANGRHSSVVAIDRNVPKKK